MVQKVSFVATLATLGSLVKADRYTLSNDDFPIPHTLTTLKRSFIYSADDNKPMPSFGTGLWDIAAPVKSRFIVNNVSVTLDQKSMLKDREKDRKAPKPHPLTGHAEVGSDGIWLAFIESNRFWDDMVPFLRDGHFCCVADDVESQTCEHVGDVIVPDSVRDYITVVPVPTNVSTADEEPHLALRSSIPYQAAKMMNPKPTDEFAQKSGVTVESGHTAVDAYVPVKETGMYYSLLVNCGNIEPSVVKAVNGNVVIQGAHGFLNGLDLPRITAAYVATGIYLALGIYWFVKMQVYRESMVFIHTFVYLMLIICAFTHMTRYIAYSWFNASLGAATFVECALVIMNSLRNAVGVILCILLCLGVTNGGRNGYSMEDRNVTVDYSGTVLYDGEPIHSYDKFSTPPQGQGLTDASNSYPMVGASDAACYQMDITVPAGGFTEDAPILEHSNYGSRLPPHVVFKLWTLFVSFFLGEILRQIVWLWHASANNSDASAIVLDVCALPSLLLAIVAFVWGKKMLDDTLWNLYQDRYVDEGVDIDNAIATDENVNVRQEQLVAANRSLYRSLLKMKRIFAIVFICLGVSAATQIAFLFLPTYKFWRIEFFLTDFIPEVMVLVSVLSVCFLWSPASTRAYTIGGKDTRDSLHMIE